MEAEGKDLHKNKILIYISSGFVNLIIKDCYIVYDGKCKGNSILGRDYVEIKSEDSFFLVKIIK